MPAVQGNIVQAEFFLNRWKNKCTVRFYDEKSVVTRFAERASWWQERREHFMRELAKDSSLLESRIERWKQHFVLRRIIAHQRRRRDVALQGLQSAIARGEVIAIDYPGPFHIEEASGALCAFDLLRRSWDVWLFIYEPDESLLQPRSSLVVSYLM